MLTQWMERVILFSNNPTLQPVIPIASPTKVIGLAMIFPYYLPINSRSLCEPEVSRRQGILVGIGQPHHIDLSCLPSGYLT